MHMCTKHETNGQIPKTYVSNSTMCYYAYQCSEVMQHLVSAKTVAPEAQMHLFWMWKVNRHSCGNVQFFSNVNSNAHARTKTKWIVYSVSCICTLKLHTQTDESENEWKMEIFFFLLNFTNTWPRVFWIMDFFSTVFVSFKRNNRNNFTTLKINKWVELVWWPNFQIFWQYSCINYSHIILSERWLTQVLSIRPSSQNSFGIRHFNALTVFTWHWFRSKNSWCIAVNIKCAARRFGVYSNHFDENSVRFDWYL